VEVATAERSPVGKLVAHHLVGYSPANEDAGEEADDGQEYLACDEVESDEQRLSKEREAVDST
jgi:hypothetical protein